MKKQGPGNWARGKQGFLRTRTGVTAPTVVSAHQRPGNETDLDDTTDSFDDLYVRFSATPSDPEQLIADTAQRTGWSYERVESVYDDVTAVCGTDAPDVERVIHDRIEQQNIVDAAPVADLAARGAHAHRYSRDKNGRITQVYYASYGSNLYEERFMVYINGGSLPGNQRVYSGTVDPTPPTDTAPVALPGAQFFAGDSRAWTGGVAFLDTSQQSSRSLGRAYRITGEQFSDVVAQENGGSAGRSTIDVTRAVDSASGVINTGGLYGQLVHVGDFQGAPVVTFTAPFTARDAARDDIAVAASGTVRSRENHPPVPSWRRAVSATVGRVFPRWKTQLAGAQDWRVFLNTPSEAYSARIAGGLQEAHGLTSQQAYRYVELTTC
jgi:hypothetical protein